MFKCVIVVSVSFFRAARVGGRLSFGQALDKSRHHLRRVVLASSRIVSRLVCFLFLFVCAVCALVCICFVCVCVCTCVNVFSFFFFFSKLPTGPKANRLGCVDGIHFQRRA